MPSDGYHMSLADFDVQEVISKGSFGTVFRAIRRADGRVFALKQVGLRGLKKVERQEAIDEARTLAQLRHPHVVRHYGTFIDADEKLNILMEYAAGGSLGAVVKAAKGGGIPETRVWRYLIQSLLGLAYIHSKKIIHRDIKPLNLFLDANDNIKIGDLGIARALAEGSDFAHTLVGTPYYLSPELCDDKPYNEKSDIWALGVVMYELCMGRHPFEAKNEGALIRKIIKGTFPPVRGSYSQALTRTIEQLMAFDPRRRPEATGLLRQPMVVAQAHTLGVSLNPRLTLDLEDALPPPAGSLAAMAGGYPSQGGPTGPPAAAAAGRPGAPHHHQKGGEAPPGRQRDQQQQAGGYRGIPAAAAVGPHPFELPADVAPLPHSLEQYQYQQQRDAQMQHLPQYHQHQQQQQVQDPWVGGSGPEPLYPAQPSRQQQQQQQYQGQQQVHHPHSAPPPAFPAGHQQQHQQLYKQQQQQPAAAPAAVGAVYSSMYQTTSQQATAAAWAAGSGEASSRYGRRRAPDLMASAPAGPRGLRGGGGRAAALAAAADDATSYYSSTYATTSVVRRH